MATREAWFQFENNLLDSQDGNDLTAIGTNSTFSSTVVQRGGYSRLYASAGTSLDQKAAVLGGIPTGTCDISFGGFLNTGTNAAGGAPISLGVSSANSSRCLWPLILSGTTIRVDLASDSKTFTVPNIAQNTWYWLWIEHSGTSRITNLYIDNVVSTTGPGTHASDMNLEATQHLNLGADVDNTNLFQGYLDHWQVWNGITTAAERETIFIQPSYTLRTLTGVGA